jgi:hypothetical protein
MSALNYAIYVRVVPDADPNNPDFKLPPGQEEVLMRQWKIMRIHIDRDDLPSTERCSGLLQYEFCNSEICYVMRRPRSIKLTWAPNIKDSETLGKGRELYQIIRMTSNCTTTGKPIAVADVENDKEEDERQVELMAHEVSAPEGGIGGNVGN